MCEKQKNIAITIIVTTIYIIFAENVGYIESLILFLAVTYIYITTID